jgi:serine/threonine-protein kinase RsbT
VVHATRGDDTRRERDGVVNAVGGLEQRVTLVLRRYMSEILAQSLRRKAQSSISVAEGRLDVAHLPALRDRIESGVRLFVDPALQGALLAELAKLTDAEAPAFELERIGVTTEADISRARLRARELAMSLGGTTYLAQRAATVVSELSRNIVAYAGSGVVELRPVAGPPAMLAIRAIDKGPGIPDVDAIMNGTYKSRTGLGKGLAGVKRLAVRFDLQTGPAGTRIDAEIAL